MDRKRLSILPGDPDTPEVRGGEPFEAYVRRDGKRLVGLAYTLCGSRAGADDIVQDALLAAFQNWEVVKGPGGTQGRLRNQRGRHSTLIKRLFDSATPGQPQPYAASPTSTRSRQPNAPQTPLDNQTGLDLERSEE